MLTTVLLVSSLAVGGVPADATGAAGAPVDTTVAVATGDRLMIDGLSGEVSIRAWDRDAVEVVSDERDGVSVRRVGSTVTVEGAGRRGRSADAAIRVPAWMDVQVRSRSLDVAVSGLQGSLQIGNVSGDISVQDAGGEVDVSSVSGDIVVVDARAGVRASSQSDDVTLRGVAGPVEAHSGDGDITLLDVTSSSVRAEAQDGDVMFSGTLAPAGEYGFYVHDGDATIALPDGTDATVRVSTFDGEFQSDFTVRVESFSAGRQFEFVLGDGGARMEIEVFDGDIRLLRRP